MKFIKPKIIISKCLEFDACRYDGQLINNKYIKTQRSYILFYFVIGLIGFYLIKKNKELILI